MQGHEDCLQRGFDNGVFRYQDLPPP
ncbi:hypothetical protein CBM2585_B20093 [Cupriavidus taiwanensis]|nr:hypothetical protein CBM2585_B20093 [Cupriavidus taiwanensis]SPC20459.1 hypothetical protein CT19431_MP80309 [Cupriavidus taiwanensis]